MDSMVIYVTLAGQVLMDHGSNSRRAVGKLDMARL